jgi:hypothetical protein
LITCDIIPGRLKSCSVPFFDLNVELLMRTYIATCSEDEDIPTSVETMPREPRQNSQLHRQMTGLRVPPGREEEPSNATLGFPALHAQKPVTDLP